MYRLTEATSKSRSRSQSPRSIVESALESISISNHGQKTCNNHCSQSRYFSSYIGFDNKMVLPTSSSSLVFSSSALRRAVAVKSNSNANFVRDRQMSLMRTLSANSNRKHLVNNNNAVIRSSSSSSSSSSAAHRARAAAAAAEGSWDNSEVMLATLLAATMSGALVFNDSANGELERRVQKNAFENRNNTIGMPLASVYPLARTSMDNSASPAFLHHSSLLPMATKSSIRKLEEETDATRQENDHMADSTKNLSILRFLTGRTLLPSSSQQATKPKRSAVDESSLGSRTYDISVRALKGGRLSMEDEYFVGSGGRFVAVFDGHGGGGVSAYLRDSLYDVYHKYLQGGSNGLGTNAANAINGDYHDPGSGGSPNDDDSDILEQGKNSSTNWRAPSIVSMVGAIRAAFEEMDRSVLSNVGLQYQGSTAVAVLLHEEEDDHDYGNASVQQQQPPLQTQKIQDQSHNHRRRRRTLVSANVGDSRAILSRRGNAVDLTRDHKPNDEKEKARILSMGETIEWDHYCKVHRVKNLSLSRAIGDKFAKPAVSGEVEIKRFPVMEEDDEFILLASDGLWDVMTSQDVVSFVHRRLGRPTTRRSIHGGEEELTSPENMARARWSRRKNMSRYVANEALRRGSSDNICVIIVWLKDENEKGDGGEVSTL